jgi:hypothetical protein
MEICRRGVKQRVSRTVRAKDRANPCQRHGARGRRAARVHMHVTDDLALEMRLFKRHTFASPFGPIGIYSRGKQLLLPIATLIWGASRSLMLS